MSSHIEEYRMAEKALKEFKEGYKIERHGALVKKQIKKEIPLGMSVNVKPIGFRLF